MFQNHLVGPKSIGCSLFPPYPPPWRLATDRYLHKYTTPCSPCCRCGLTAWSYTRSGMPSPAQPSQANKPPNIHIRGNLASLLGHNHLMNLVLYAPRQSTMRAPRTKPSHPMAHALLRLQYLVGGSGSKCLDPKYRMKFSQPKERPCGSRLAGSPCEVP